MVTISPCSLPPSDRAGRELRGSALSTSAWITWIQVTARSRAKQPANNPIDSRRTGPFTGASSVADPEQERDQDHVSDQGGAAV